MRGKGKRPDPVSRLQTMQDRRESPVLPPNPAPHITDWFMEIGPTFSTGMGERPIEWPDMDAWCNRVGIDLDPWEARTIRRLSKAYARQVFDAKKPDCPAPYIGNREVITDRRGIVANKLKAVFRSNLKGK